MIMSVKIPPIKGGIFLSIFWDEFATTNKYSGIGVYSEKLSESLKCLDIIPNRISENRLMSSKFSHFLKINYNSLGLNPCIFHGLANFNTPILNKNVKTVITIHDIIPLLARNDVSLSSRVQLSILLKFVLPCVDQIICVSDWTRDSLIEYFPSYDLSEKIQVIPNGFLTFEPLPRESNSKVNVLFISRYEGYKNFDLLRSIIENSNQDKVHFNVVTDDKGLEYLSDLSNKNCSVYKRVDDKTLKSLYKQCSLLLHTSSYEGFCLPAMEAIRYARPVLYLKGSAIDTTVGEDGVGLCSKSNIDLWNDKILELGSDAYYNRFKENVSSNIELRPSWLDNAKRVKEIYNKLIG